MGIKGKLGEMSAEEPIPDINFKKFTKPIFSRSLEIDIFIWTL